MELLKINMVRAGLICSNPQQWSGNTPDTGDGANEILGVRLAGQLQAHLFKPRRFVYVFNFWNNLESNQFRAYNRDGWGSS